LNKNNKLIENINVILEDAKTEQIKIIDIRKNSSFADTLIIATCRSTRHADATANILIEKLKKLDLICPKPEGRPKCDWVIVDVGTIVIHLFKKETRKLYNLEKLWDIGFDLIENKLA
tara:strand:- start:3077 stop:3430 length:354 start_codon:yes stop_codon:yes gene_type:complete